MTDAVTVHTIVAAPPDVVIAWLRDARHMPLWAGNFADRVEPDGEDWIAHGADGAKRLRLVAENPFGICDHWVALPDGAEIHMPIRVLPLDGQSLVGFTIVALPGWDAARLDADAALVRADMERLRRAIETGA